MTLPSNPCKPLWFHVCPSLWLLCIQVQGRNIQTTFSWSLMFLLVMHSTRCWILYDWISSISEDDLSSVMLCLWGGHPCPLPSTRLMFLHLCREAVVSLYLVVQSAKILERSVASAAQLHIGLLYLHQWEVLRCHSALLWLLQELGGPFWTV